MEKQPKQHSKAKQRPAPRITYRVADPIDETVLDRAFDILFEEVWRQQETNIHKSTLDN